MTTRHCHIEFFLLLPYLTLSFRLFGPVLRCKGNDDSARRSAHSRLWECRRSMPSKAARWQYYLSNSVDDKNLGWKSYDAAGTKELEGQWQQQQSDPSTR